jgi:hypothetical protein
MLVCSPRSAIAAVTFWKAFAPGPVNPKVTSGEPF